VASANGPLLVYEEGDLVGVNSSELYPLTIETTSFAAVVSVFSTEHLHAQAAQSQQSMAVLNDYLCASSMLFLSLLAERLRLSTSLTPVLRVYHAGEVILAQGNSGNSVMTMVEGEAHVEVDGVQVGVVHKDEIFGAIAAITGSERSATVVAASDCLVMELEATQFQALLQTHPALVTRLICDMAKTIKSLNTQLVGQVVHTAQQL
jgi:CRP-like cAMP-binding protein